MELEPHEETALFALSVVAGGSNLPENRIPEFAEGHGGNIYIPLTLVGERGKRWPKNITNTDLGKELVEQYDLTTNYCGPCVSPETTAEHFIDPLHASRVAAQQFRLNATVSKWELIQKWEAEHALNWEYRSTRAVKVKLTLEWSNCTYPTDYHYTRLASTGRSIPLIEAKTELGCAEFHFEFQYWNTNPNVEYIFLYPTSCQEDGYICHHTVQLPLQGHRHAMNFKFYSTTPGYKYYTIQVWVVIYKKSREPVFFPLCCEIQIEWKNTGFDKAIDDLIRQVPQRYKLEDGEIPISTIPNSPDSPPNNQREGFVLERIHKPTTLNHPLLKPYFDAWLNIEDDKSLASSNQRFERELRLGDQPATSGEVLGIKNLVDIKVPLTKNNIKQRNLIEVIGQTQHQENTSNRARVLLIRYITWNVDFPLENDTNVNDLSALTVHVTVSTVDYKGLRGIDSSDTLRLMHSSWKLKHSASIIREELQPDNGCISLELKLNSIAKRDVCPLLEVPPDAQRDMEPCYLLPPSSLVTGYLTTLYRVLNRLDENQDANKSKPPAVPLDEDNEATSAEIPVETRISNKDWNKENFLNRFEAITDRLFQEPDAPHTEPRPKTVIRPEHEQFANKLDPSQRAVLDSVFSGAPLVSCEAPPGSGKTFLIALIVVLAFLADPEAFILCVTPTNTASDVLGRNILAFMREIIGHVPLKSLLRFVRLGYSVSELGPLFEYSNLGKSDLVITDDPSVNASRLYEHKIMVQTIDLATMNNINTNKTSKANGDSIYKIVIVDEAACVDLPKLNVLMTLGESGQIVLIGDTRQLPAFITSMKVKALGGDESGMAIVNRTLTLNKNGVLLNLYNNYRSVKPIINPSNRIMYHENPVEAVNDAKLNHAIEQQNRACGHMLRNHILPGPTRCGVSFMHVEGKMSSHGSSYYNKDELFALHSTIMLLIWMGIPQEDIGIDCTYAAQSALARILLSRFPAIRIGCTNTWQGNERDYMIITLVQSKADKAADVYGIGQTSGFLEDLRRLNVALTRARKGAIVIGNALHFITHPLIVEILREVCTNNSWIDEPLRNAAGSSYNSNKPRYVTPWAVRYFVHYAVCESHPNPKLYVNKPKLWTITGVLHTATANYPSLLLPLIQVERRCRKNGCKRHHSLPNLLDSL